MSDPHRRLGARLGHFFERWMSSLVMECRCEDGSRLLIGLDPTWYGMQAITVLDHIDPSSNDQRDFLAPTPGR